MRRELSGWKRNMETTGEMGSEMRIGLEMRWERRQRGLGVRTPSAAQVWEAHGHDAQEAKIWLSR